MPKSAGSLLKIMESEHGRLTNPSESRYIFFKISDAQGRLFSGKIVSAE